MKYKSIISLITVMAVVFYAQFSNGSKQNSTSVGIGVNFRLYPSTVSQTETFITRHPSNPNILFASSNAYSFSGGLFTSEGIYVSTNSGANWYGNDTCTGNPINFHGGDPGIAIDKNGIFILTRLGRSPFQGLYSHYSTDNGMTWSSQATVSTDLLERATTVSDGNPLSTYYGRTYTAWVKFSPPYPVNISFSDNGALSWASQVQVNNPPQRCSGGEITVGPLGKVHLTWAGVQSISPFTEIYVGYASTLNGGQNWNVTENAFTINGIQGFLPEKNSIRVNGLPRISVDNSGGPRNGWIYIVTTQKNLPPAGTDPDIILNRSTNGGQSWLPAVRVNQDPLNDGKIQYFPAIHVDDDGGLNIIYYDDRLTTSDSAGVFLSRSTDGGATWKDHLISNHNFEPSPISGGGQGYQGDNIALTSVGDILWAVWMDNSVNNNYQAWACPVDLNSIGIENNYGIIPGVFELKQNYPNPFNPSTKIEYNILKSGHVSLKVYDINGREIEELVDMNQMPGKYIVDFTDRLSSGVYFYTLKVGDYNITRKMVLLK